VTSTERFGRAAGAVGALTFLSAGLWAMAAPRSFFDHLATFEPYNQHLIQDIGAFQIGIGAVLALAVLRPTMGALAVALLGSGLGGAFHALSHVIGRDLGGRPASDIPIFSVTAAVLLSAGVIVARHDRDGDPGTGTGTEHRATRSASAVPGG
jgi:hypothetical protein